MWWFSNISARASKIELGIASLVIGNTGEKEEFRLVPQCVLSWCDVLKVYSPHGEAIRFYVK